jgi:2-polyprenyl-3-methyl-5-hydroxy-6-metoxy-1,4-benzoquinol methylase
MTNIIETQSAYAAMTMDENHKWAAYTAHEIDIFLQVINPTNADLAKTTRFLDVGCGTGRHSFELAQRGYTELTGIDFVSERIAECRRISEDKHLPIEFYYEDMTEYTGFGDFYDHVLCLYDVIGTYASDRMNQAVLQNIFNLLRPGGYLLASVMNGELTASQAKHIATGADLPAKVDALEISDLMHTTGNIFDPNYYVWAANTGVAYRRERRAGSVSVIGDRRYTANDIGTLFERAGFDVQFTRYVRLGHWQDNLEPLDARAKEILILGRKPNY